MRDAETVLNVIRDRGMRGLPLDDVYRQLFNPEFYLLEYARIYRNDGAMTAGITTETVDGMSQTKINAIIEAVRFERYKWTPARRTEIPKKNGKTRPLGIPIWSDKLLQAVVRTILEAYYEPQFCDHSYGFRPERGCHTALTEVYYNWLGTKWFIEGDIRGCFDNIDHSVLMSILRERILDNRFLRLIENLLGAGYLKDWKYYNSLSGTPQGGVVSPILSNIYLDKLDRFVEETLKPQYTLGKRRRNNPEYMKRRYQARKCRERGEFAEAVVLDKSLREIPSSDPDDPNYRRLKYVRYADDFLIGFVGTKDEAEAVKVRVREFLTDNLRLELSDEKTLITHASTEAARFLGYEITILKSDVAISGNGKRGINGKVGLRVPWEVIQAKCAPYMRNGKPIHRPERTNDSDFSIVSQYQSEYRGIVNYYALAINVGWFNKLKWIMEASLLKTLANKHKTYVPAVSRKFSRKVMTEFGPRKCIVVTVHREGKEPLIARWGGIPLRRRKNAEIEEPERRQPHLGNSDLLQRLLADKCETCGSKEFVEVHHIRKLKDLKVPGTRIKPLWMKLMAAKRRKTLVLCRSCHDKLHAGRPLPGEQHE